MDFSWSKEQQELYDRIRAFAEQKLGGSIQARDSAQEFSAPEWRLCGDFGLLGLSVPERHGGMGLNALTTALAVEAFGRGCEDSGLVFSASAHLFACLMPIAEFGAEEIQDRFLPRLCRGELVGANAITEAESGSDVFSMKARAVRDGEAYVITGEKFFVTNGPIADVILVYAATNPAHRFMGLSAFLVPGDTPGVTIGQTFNKTGLSTSPMCSIHFDACRVPAANRLGAEGQGGAVFTSSMQWERACLFAAWIGVMERQLKRTVAYAKARRQFGKAIGKFQATAHRIVDMRLRLDAARLLLYRACWAKDRQRDATLEIALAKLAVSEAAIRSSLDAVQVHGGAGILMETGIERGLRDCLSSTIYSGTSEIQRDLIARHLGL